MILQAEYQRSIFGGFEFQGSVFLGVFFGVLNFKDLYFWQYWSQMLYF